MKMPVTIRRHLESVYQGVLAQTSESMTASQKANVLQEATDRLAYLLFDDKALYTRHLAKSDYKETRGILAPYL